MGDSNSFQDAHDAYGDLLSTSHKASQVQFRLVAHVLNESLPLIYMWEIHEACGSLVGRYVGKAKAGARRPLKHYKRNVANILSNKPYRRSNPSGYRRVHQALAEAERTGRKVTLQFLCNVAANENINEVEQRYIRLHGCSGGENWQLNG